MLEVYYVSNRILQEVTKLLWIDFGRLLSSHFFYYGAKVLLFFELTKCFRKKMRFFVIFLYFSAQYGILIAISDTFPTRVTKKSILRCLHIFRIRLCNALHSHCTTIALSLHVVLRAVKARSKLDERVLSVFYYTNCIKSSNFAADFVFLILLTFTYIRL